MPNPDPATGQPRARAPTRRPFAPRLLLALLTPGPILAALAALTDSATLRALTATLAAHALIAAPLLAIALLILAAVTTSDGARGDEPTTPDAL
jgi:chromate transport protein ChrA